MKLLYSFMQLKPVFKLLDYVNLRFLYLPKVLLKMFCILKILIPLLNSLNSSNFLPPNTIQTTAIIFKLQISLPYLTFG